MTPRPPSRRWRVVALAAGGALLLTGAVTAFATGSARVGGASNTSEATRAAPLQRGAADEPSRDRITEPVHRVPSPEEVAALPDARYDAVIAGLLDAAHEPAERYLGERVNFSLLSDAPLYEEERTTPVARLAAVNFLGEPTVVVPVRWDGEWTLVLTPARQALPSTVRGHAPAQTMGWIRTDALAHPRHVTATIVVDVSAQSLTIVDRDGTIVSFPVGVGTPGTPTPTGTGYLQARYLDPAQGQIEHRVQLTSLHSAAADEPYGGADGGLIGLHYSPDSAGSVSHGCIRLSPEAVRAVDALPLGTIVSVIG